MLAVPRIGTAQSASPAAAEEPACLGFVFGAWTPALDWKAAGHRANVDTGRVARTAEGRGWAAPSVSAAGDTALILFPVWWPAGVVVELSTKAPAPGDTVRGRARAMVADGGRQSPTSIVLAWRVPCRR